VWRCRAAAALIGLAIVLTQLEFPRRYADLVAADPGVRALVSGRDAALLAALALLIARLAGPARSRRPAVAPERSAPGRP